MIGIMEIAIASDHAGWELKTEISARLVTLGHILHDKGCHSGASVDFPDHVYPAALAVSRGECERAILIDGAGYPSGMLANMLPDVFAAVCNDPVGARLAREHSDANTLCLGAKIIGSLMAEAIVKTFLETAYLGGRYAGRVEKLKAISARHRRPLTENQARQVLTLKDIQDAVSNRRTLVIDSKTVITPSVLDLLR